MSLQPAHCEDGHPRGTPEIWAVGHLDKHLEIETVCVAQLRRGQELLQRVRQPPVPIGPSRRVLRRATGVDFAADHAEARDVVLRAAVAPQPPPQLAKARVLHGHPREERVHLAFLEHILSTPRRGVAALAAQQFAGEGGGRRLSSRRALAGSRKLPAGAVPVKPRPWRSGHTNLRERCRAVAAAPPM